MRVLARAALLALAGAASLLVFAAPAAADLSGPCSAVGTFVKSKVVVDAKIAMGAIEVEPEDEVEYAGAVLGATPPRKVSGEIKVDLPFPLPDFSPGEWSNDAAAEIDKTDTYSYELPTIAPRGYEVEVTGFHEDAGLPTCRGSVTLKVKGGFFSSPAGPAAAVVTILSASGVVMAARPKERI